VDSSITVVGAMKGPTIEEDSTTSNLPKIKTSYQDCISQTQFEFQTPSLLVWIFVTLFLLLLFAVAFLPSIFLGPLEVFREGMYIVGPPQLWQSISYVVVLVHVVEATFALYLAQKVDPQNVALWFWQTLYLGFFSLGLLLQNAK